MKEAITQFPGRSLGGADSAMRCSHAGVFRYLSWCGKNVKQRMFIDWVYCKAVVWLLGLGACGMRTEARSGDLGLALQSHELFSAGEMASQVIFYTENRICLLPSYGNLHTSVMTEPGLKTLY